MTHAPPRPRRHRVGAALVAAGLLCAAGAVAGWRAAPANAAELFSFELNAGARGFNFYSGPFKDAGLDDPGAGIGETQASLASGPVGLGLSSVAWPGPIAANGGTLLLVLQPGCTVTGQIGLEPGGTPACPLPDEAGNAANYPLRAEARTGQKEPSVTNDSVPGTKLSASATDEKVTADSVIASATGLPGNFGNINAHSETRTEGGKGIADAVSNVQNVDIGGVIKIKSIMSRATANTDGSKSGGNGTTVVTGLTIADQPATIDGTGLHLGGQDGDVSAVTKQIQEQALKQMGVEIVVGAPTKEINGGTAVVGAPSVVISWEPPGEESPGKSALVFGGATASVTASQGEGLGDLLGADLGADLGSGGGAAPVDAGAAPIDAGSLDVGSTGDAGTASGGGEEVALGETQNAAGGRPLKPGAVFLGVLAAGLLAAGMKRLSDDVLTERAGTTCPLEEAR